MFERFREPLKPVMDFFAKYFTWLHPNAITIIGFFLGFIPILFFFTGNPRLGGIMLPIYLFDSLDGAVARYTGRVSRFGEVLDATFDRVIDGLTIFAIAKGGFISWNFAIVALLGFYLVSYVRARTGEAAAKKVKLDVGIAQRGDRIFILAVASILYFEEISLPFLAQTVNTLQIAFVLLCFLTWFTVIQRLLVAYKRLKPLEKKNE